HGFVFFVHAAREVRIAQVLVARRLRHVLEHIQAAANGALAIRGKLLVLRSDIVLDVLPLLWGHAAPDALAVSELLLLLRREPAELLLILLPFLRRRRALRERRPVRIARTSFAARRTTRGRARVRIGLRRAVGVSLRFALRLPFLLLLLARRRLLFWR